MSLAGWRSNRGDEYQRSIATFWIVQMLTDKSIKSIQVDAISVPDISDKAYQDDIIIHLESNKRIYIQAKINQTNHHSWKLTDKVFSQELIKAKDQLIIDQNSEYHFYSRTPFDSFQALVEQIRLYETYSSFNSNAPNKQKDLLDEISQILKLDLVKTFELVKRVKLGDHHSAEGWEKFSKSLLKDQFSNTQLCYDLLYRYVDKMHSNNTQTKILIDRQSTISFLQERKVYELYDFND